MLRTRPARRGSASYRFASMGRCAAKEVNQDREIVFRLPELQRLYKQLDKERFAPQTLLRRSPKCLFD